MVSRWVGENMTERDLTDAERDAIRELDALDPGDKEGTHTAADAIVVAVAHSAVQAAYHRAATRTGPWWYA